MGRIPMRTRMRLLGSAAAVLLACSGGIAARASADASKASTQPSTSSSSASSRRSKAASVASSSTAKTPTRKRRAVAGRAPVQKAPTPDRISEIQSALARAGYYQGDPTSKWDPDTIAAMQKFQSANGLDSTGKLDALSLQKLGLGSAIAGVSAPTVPPSQHSPATRGASSSSLQPATSGPHSSLTAGGAATTASNMLSAQ